MRANGKRRKRCAVDKLRTVLAAMRANAELSELCRRGRLERTIAWLNRSRRLCKDYEREPSSSEAMIQVSMIT
jgi:transposase